ncbi:MAG: Uma2 family endonuclease [candidate division KSB1 bacterium]|nr:Uma2 family endonuclease [candidate division KSB1 bacterium]MDZ7304087.1 Uma2 family endonuclease [candidate division KSB1 bacterium]MDZ7312067.1 Uma2 family endonuclease [candidate division KSB1 bacterium]
MAEAIDTLELEAPKHKIVPPAADKAISSGPLPIEQRTDVTVDELERMSLPYPAELYNGKVVFKMANPLHGMIQLKIGKRLDLYLDKNPVGYVMTETNFRLWPDRPKESRIPDVAFVKKEHLPENLLRFPPGAPDLAVEIYSADEKLSEVLDKIDAYLEQGTRVVWLIIPHTREALIFTAGSRFKSVDVLTAPELLPGFELPVDKIFENIPMPDQS